MEIRFDHGAIEEEGPFYARVRLTGRALDATRRRPAVDVSIRLEFFAGLSTIRLAVALTNPKRARHRGGIWELGDPNSLHIREAAVRIELPPGETRRRVGYSIEPDDPWRNTEDDVEVHQESSGGDAWASRNHVNAEGVVPLRYQGYRALLGTTSTRGLRATPVLQIVGTATTVAVATERFWENFPKTIKTAERSIELELFPRSGAHLYEIQPGERKTHSFTVVFGDDALTEEPLAWVRAPLLVTAAPESSLAAEPLLFLAPFGSDPEADALLQDAVAGPHSFLRKREDVDEYGWRHFGDLYADHEAVNSHNLLSHYNNQYDAIAGFATQYLRTGEARWWTLMDDLAAHVADIDIYHARADKSAYSGGLFWHTYHYVDAGKSTHRSYPRGPSIAGGGPANEHNYSTGLMLHHLLTGSPDSREAAIGLAEWVIAMDDGALTPFRWLARGNTGLASSTASTSYHGPGRGAGNSISVLLNAHRLSGDPRFLGKAEELIARCIGPDDDIEALDLLDAERRWSYTVFLQAMGRYLLHKVERGEIDDRYAYARASLCHYVRWMARSEYPYLDKPEILEFPTETWAAQDLRKAEVFILGALCAGPDERPHLVERAEFFHRRSVKTLQQFGTAWLTRPLVILLSTLGAVPWWRQTAAPEPLPEGPVGFVHRRPEFVPQRARAIRRARMILAASAGALAFGVGLLLF